MASSVFFRWFLTVKWESGMLGFHCVDVDATDATDGFDLFLLPIPSIRS